MATVSGVFGGQSGVIYMQTGANPTPLARSAFQTYIDITTTPGSTNFVAIPVKELPDFGYDGQSASFSQAGSPVGGQVTVQGSPKEMSLDILGLTGAALSLVLGDTQAGAGQILRTFLIYVPQGNNAIEYIWNGRLIGFNTVIKPNAEVMIQTKLIPDSVADGTVLNNTNWFGIAVKP